MWVFGNDTSGLKNPEVQFHFLAKRLANNLKHLKTAKEVRRKSYTSRLFSGHNLFFRPPPLLFDANLLLYLFIFHSCWLLHVISYLFMLFLNYIFNIILKHLKTYKSSYPNT